MHGAEHVFQRAAKQGVQVCNPAAAEPICICNEVDLVLHARSVTLFDEKILRITIDCYSTVDRPRANPEVAARSARITSPKSITMLRSCFVLEGSNEKEISALHPAKA